MLYISPDRLKKLRGPLRGTLIRRNAPVTLAGLAKASDRRKKLGRGRYYALVDSVVSVLKTGVWSKFEFEGACRSGIRSRLCSEGWRWFDADSCALAIVGEALGIIGAVRPTWNEGQPDHVHEDLVQRTRCAHCGTRIPDEREGRLTKYCSDNCRSTAKIVRDRIHGERVSMAEHLARCAAQSAQTLADRSKHCGHCGSFFFTKDPNRKHCSKRCADAAATFVAPRACAQCDVVFTPANSKNDRKFCSHECSTQHNIKPRPEVTCKGCSTIFVKKRPSDVRSYCTDECARRHRSYGRPKIICQEITT